MLSNWSRNSNLSPIISNPDFAKARRGTMLRASRRCDAGMASGSQPDPRQDRPCAQVNVGNWVAHRTAATAHLGWLIDGRQRPNWVGGFNGSSQGKYKRGAVAAPQPSPQARHSRYTTEINQISSPIVLVNHCNNELRRFGMISVDFRAESTDLCHLP